MKILEREVCVIFAAQSDLLILEKLKIYLLAVAKK
jgi:hypothetical protein